MSPADPGMSPYPNMNKRAFTLVEYMIVLVIIGLLAAMAIPAFQAVKMQSIEKAIQRGDKVSKEDRAAVNEWNKSHNKPIPSVSVAEQQPDISEPVAGTNYQSIQTIRVKDKTYYLIPKQDLTETTIAGQTYYLVPSSK